MNPLREVAESVNKHGAHFIEHVSVPSSHSFVSFVRTGPIDQQHRNAIGRSIT